MTAASAPAVMAAHSTPAAELSTDCSGTVSASLLGLTPDQARQVKLDNCAISMIERDDEATTVTTLNAGFHLQGLAA